MVPARVILGLMAFLMFLVTQMVRLNLNIAIVAMTENPGNSSLNQSLAWTEHTKGVLLGAFYWSYWLTELPGGLLAQRFGGRYTLCGVTWPAMHSISAHWIPKTERSKFMTSYHGASVGTAVTYPLSGLVIASFGWEYVFYLTGTLSIIWCICWWLLVFDSPAQHPRLSERERKYLEKSLGKSVSLRKASPLTTPWKAIFLSGPFWAVLLASQGLMWGTMTLSMQLPTYLNNVHNLDIQTNGLVSGLPDLSKFLFGLVFSAVMDYMLKRSFLSITTVRKISVVVCEYLPAVLLVLLSHVGYENAAVAAAILSFSTAVGGASSSGSLANIVDISPNFAGTVLGLIKLLTVVPGVLSPLMVSFFVSTMEPIICWQYVFGIIAAIYVVCCTAFLAFGSGEVQPWNETQSQIVELEDLTKGNSGLKTGTSIED
ncbi:sialin isoform X2 [Anabrus simplex]|uniref:sialin isoform X2 n=1 Tax=Anabrus simplex TaxID=316456 RepID=UPI0035A2D2C4